MGVASFRRLYPIDCGLQWRQITLPFLSVPNYYTSIFFLPVLLCWGFLARMLLLASRLWYSSTFLFHTHFRYFHTTVLHTVPPSPLEEILKDYDMSWTVKALKTERRYYIKRGHVPSTPQAPLESGEKSPLTTTSVILDYDDKWWFWQRWETRWYDDNG